jgi:hypothetical protein
MPPHDETDVGAVRTVVTPAPGPFTAALTFRVGVADEAYATSGITRRVAHLAAPDATTVAAGAAVTVSATTTTFRATGSPADVVAYLNTVCANLRMLPADLPRAAAPEAPSAAAAPTTLAARRYGPRGHGLTGYPELAPQRLSAEALRDWALTRFTRADAVLRLTGTATGTVPEGLGLALPEGPGPDAGPGPGAGSRPETRSLFPLPAYFHGAADDPPVMDGIVRRSAAAAVFAAALSGARYEPRDSGYATVTLALTGTEDPLAALSPDRLGRLGQAELDAARTAATDDDGDTTAITPRDLQAVAREFAGTALLRLPPGRPAPDGFTAAPRYSPAPAPGGNDTRHRSLQDVDYRLVLSPEAVTLSGPEGFVTVSYDRCAAMLSYPDGGRVLTGFDGFVVAVEPSMYAMLTPDRIALIDAAVDPSVVVRMPARDPGSVPRPDPSADQRAALTSRTRTAGPAPAVPLRRTIALYLCCVATAAAALVAIKETWQQLSAPDPHYTIAAMFWVATVALIVVIRDLRGPKKDHTHVVKWWNWRQ